MCLLQHLNRRLEAFRWTAGQLDHLTSQRGQDVPVRRIARPGQCHPVTMIKAARKPSKKAPEEPVVNAI